MPRMLRFRLSGGAAPACGHGPLSPSASPAASAPPPASSPVKASSDTIAVEREMKRLGLSRLAAQRVRPPTQIRYAQCLLRLLAFLQLLHLPDWTPAEWDAALVNYLEAQYDWGRPIGDGLCLPSAVVWARPALGGPVRRLFPATAAALKGWSRVSPGSTRPPLPREALLAIALWLFEAGAFGMGLCLLVMFETYGRPSEILSLRVGSIVPPTPCGEGKARHTTVVIRSSAIGVPGKTGIFDLSVPLDLERQRWISALLLRWTEGRAAGEALWNFDLAQLTRALHRATEALGLGPLSPCPYMLRHGGASHDRLVEARSLLEVQQRGAWLSFASVRRYEKHGLIGQQLLLLPVAVRVAICSQASSAAASCARAFSRRFGTTGPASDESLSSSSPATLGLRRRLGAVGSAASPSTSARGPTATCCGSRPSKRSRAGF